ncbi:response regulator transcription factor [Paenibacillus xanthanilyticus]|uniref:Response regulator n=1 Tax=Paenibacillus xanthanilyticus TaxID=1783531 RepID=A0ABV8K5L4_9BACL
MKTILIVDDETRQVKALSAILRRLRPAYRILEAADAKAAWSLLESEAVDAVLTDIRMPEEDGLTLVERIAGGKPHIKTVLISGYGQFDYARKAIEHRVVDYLVKPIGLSDIERVLAKLEVLFSEEREREQLNKERIWQDVLFGDASGSTAERAERCASPGGPGVVIVFELGRGDPIGLITELKRKWRTESASAGQSEIVTDPTGRRAAAIMRLTPALAAKPSESVAKLSRLLDHVRSDGGEHIAVGVSRTRADVHASVAEAYAEALLALRHRFYAPEQTVFWGTDSQPFAERISPSAKEIAEPLLTAIKAVEGGRALDLVNAFFCQRESPPYPKPGLMKDETWMLIWQLLNGMESLLSDDAPEWSIARLRERFQGYDDYRELRLRFKELVRHLLALTEKTQQDKNGLIIMRCQHYLQQHYMEDLSLESVAAKFHFNASYFSYLFKLRTGMNFSEYVLDLRIRQAKRMLAQTDAKVAEISERSGFRTPAYFNKMFKREIGLSPKTYRQMHGEEAAE